MSTHRAFVPDLSTLAPGDRVDLDSDDAHHLLRVKRAETGDPVTLLDGQGRIADASIDATGKRGRDTWIVTCRITAVRAADRVTPELHFWTASPKGDRLQAMIDALSQVGAASWSPMTTARTVVEPREHKLDKLHRVAVEAAKQCGRAWTLEIGDGGSLDAALTEGPVVLADGSGTPYTRLEAQSLRVLVGPEGGFTPEELDAARAAGARIHRFGPHIMRIEAAAPAITARILAAHGV